MTIKALSLTAIAGAMLCACSAQNVWVRPGSTEAQFNQDSAYCQAQAQQAEAAAIGYSGFLAGYESVQTHNACMRARGWALMKKDAALEAQRSQIVWVKDALYSRSQRNADLADCKRLNPNVDGVPPCMEARGYVSVTAGELYDAAAKLDATGAISKSVSSEAESQARAQKVIHAALASRQ